MNVGEQELINLFKQRRNFEIQEVLLDKRLKELLEQIKDNNILLRKSKIVSEIYNDIPIKIVTIEEHSHEPQTPHFWRLFPLFIKGEDRLYSANIFKKIKGSGHGLSLFRKDISVCLPYSYTKDVVFTVAKEWITSHKLPERETLYLEKNPDGSYAEGSKEAQTVNNTTYKPKTNSYPKIYRPSQEPDDSSRK